MLSIEIIKRKGMVILIENKDTICLLKECDAGSKMAVSSIDDVVEKVSDSAMKQLLQESKKHHEKLGNEIHAQLNKHGANEKEPAAMAKGMSWMKTTMKMSMDNSDATVADLITDGCDMGIKSLHKYMNEYTHADGTSKELCNKLIGIEEELKSKLEKYL